MSHSRIEKFGLDEEGVRRVLREELLRGASGKAEGIARMLNRVGGMVRSIQSLWIERKQAPVKERISLFDETLSPLYLEMSEIHGNYMNLCRAAVTSLSDQITAAEFGIRPDISNDPSRHVTISQIKREYQLNRQEMLAQRSALRRDAQKIFAEMDELPHEAAFLYTIWNYFMRTGRGLSLLDMAKKAQYLGENSPHQTVNTPSNILYARIEKEEDPGKLLKMFIEERETLSEYWSEVSERFSDLKRAARHAKEKMEKAF